MATSKILFGLVDVSDEVESGIAISDLVRERTEELAKSLPVITYTEGIIRAEVQGQNPVEVEL